MRIAPPSKSVTYLGETKVRPAASWASEASSRPIASRVLMTPCSASNPSMTATTSLLVDGDSRRLHEIPVGGDLFPDVGVEVLRGQQHLLRAELRHALVQVRRPDRLLGLL